MEKKPEWDKLTRRIEQLLRLKTFPVAFKMLENKDDLNKIPFLRRTNHKITMCQLISMVRNYDWTVGADAEDFMGPMCPSILGMTDTPEIFKDGTSHSIVWVKTKKDGRKYEESIPRFPAGKYQAVAMGPLVYGPFEPDIVLVYANPAQVMLLINSLQFEDYEVMQFHSVGESSCADLIVRTYKTGKPSVSIPCYGERRYGHAQDEDLAIAIPAGMMEKAVKGMEALYRRGIRYPITYAGIERDITAAFPMTHSSLDQYNLVRGNDNRLLLGITGGIASGKSTVANMLEKMGAPLIDFDVLSRIVVEPDKPAWQEIVAYFGEQVLQEDRHLDRKKISEIVFQDTIKRQKLENIIHPQIQMEFVKQVNYTAGANPNAIIQVAVPLLLEVNMQHLFHKVIVVYISREKQVERLVKRDGISEREAENILNAQLHIDEKLTYADYVINNEGSVEETEKQVKELWQNLVKLQEERAGQS